MKSSATKFQAVRQQFSLLSQSNSLYYQYQYKHGKLRWKLQATYGATLEDNPNPWHGKI